MMRRLRKNWVKLHKLVYVIAVLGILHFLWLVKSDISEPVVYGAILAVLLGFRVFWYLRGRSRQPAGASG